MNELVFEWLRLAKLDLIAIEEMKNNENLNRISAFHAQQCVEKCFKAILEFLKFDIPKIHNLEKLYTLISDSIKFEINDKILDVLNLVYLNSRYPNECGLLPNGEPSSENINDFYNFAYFIYNKSFEFIEDKEILCQDMLDPVEEE